MAQANGSNRLTCRYLVRTHTLCAFFFARPFQVNLIIACTHFMHAKCIPNGLNQFAGIHINTEATANSTRWPNTRVSRFWRTSKWLQFTFFFFFHLWRCKLANCLPKTIKRFAGNFYYGYFTDFTNFPKGICRFGWLQWNQLRWFQSLATRGDFSSFWSQWTVKFVVQNAYMTLLANVCSIISVKFDQISDFEPFTNRYRCNLTTYFSIFSAIRENLKKNGSNQLNYGLLILDFPKNYLKMAKKKQFHQENCSNFWKIIHDFELEAAMLLPQFEVVRKIIEILLSMNRYWPKLTELL